MKKLKKFQKFALSTEQASKVKGGVQMMCKGEIIAADSIEHLMDFASELGCLLD